MSVSTYGQLKNCVEPIKYYFCNSCDFAGFEPATISTPARQIANSTKSAYYHWQIIGNIFNSPYILKMGLCGFLFFSLPFFFPLHFINIGLLSALLYIYFLFLFNLKRGVFIHYPIIDFIAWVG